MNFSDNQAYRLINNVIDDRIRSLTRSGAGIDYTWGTVARVDSPYQCSVYLFGDTTPSVGFRTENGLAPNVLDPVRVAIDKRGNRWIEAILNRSDTTYPKLAIDVRNGKITFNEASGVHLVFSSLGADSINSAGSGATLVLNETGGDVFIGNDLIVHGEAHSENESWKIPTLQNSWVNYGASYNNAGYRKDANGYVHLRGLIRNGATAIGTVIFTLPTGYLPNGQELQIVISDNGIGRVDISTAGNVLFQSGSNVWFSLDGITFKAS